MANFTQLHLSNKSQGTSQEKSNREQAAKELARRKVLFGSTLFAVTALSGVFLLITNGCSKGTSKVTSQNQVTPNSTSSVTPPAQMVSTAVVPTDNKPARKHVVQKKAPTATFSDPINGVSFRYPKTYVLKTGNEPSLDLAGMGPLQMNFVQAGGSNVAAVELPKNMYPGTDFGSAFFSVSVNPELSESECSQFAFPLSLHQENDPGSPSKTSPSKAKIGGTEFSMVEDFGIGEQAATDQNEPSLKYYHRFENGNCYEFTTGVSITPQTGDDVKPVNRAQVFHKLEQILATVKVEPAVVPEVAKGTQHPVIEGSKE
jgi:hypothetical protein